MKQAQYPQRMCKEGLFSPGGIAHYCELVDLHPGPCASFSITSTIQVRNVWEAEHPGWESGIGDMTTYADAKPTPKTDVGAAQTEAGISASGTAPASPVRKPRTPAKKAAAKPATRTRKAAQ